ncbi:MAG TPA: diacylglycerol kinase family protein [Candidatus Dormibacteraeota bacterium]|nr:diacylglycerol kinase family protein [Candidatus Dormibacteraeota bacterium]
MGPPDDAERRRALFVVNPALQRTGSDFGRRLLELAGELGWEAMVLETKAGLNVEAIGAALARREFHLVLAAGGDGTVAEVMAAAHQRSLPMGIVPLGTANIVARELGLPAGWRRATRRVLEHFPATRAVDLARVNDGYMALAAGIGFDATVMRHTPATLKYWFGRAAYFVAGAWWLPRAPHFECTIRADGEEMKITAVVVLIVNAGMLGAAPFRFGPNIAIDDGWLDVCVYRPRTALDRAGVLWRIFRQRADGDSMLQRKARSVEIIAPDVQWNEVDGEVYRGNVLRAQIVAGGVKVVV